MSQISEEFKKRILDNIDNMMQDGIDCDECIIIVRAGDLILTAYGHNVDQPEDKKLLPLRRFIDEIIAANPTVEFLGSGIVLPQKIGDQFPEDPRRKGK